MAVVISGLTGRQNVYIEGVTAWREGTEVTPTGLPVQFAAVALAGDPLAAPPVETDWVAGAWLAGAPEPTPWILVGRTGSGATIERASGEYALWLRILGATEQPEEMVGVLVIP